MSGGVSKRVYSSRRNVDIGGGVVKAGLPGSVGISSMLRRFIARRAPDGGKNAVVSELIWRQIKKLIGTYPQNGASFGFSVAISGKYVVVGAPSRDNNDETTNANTNEGAAYVFKYS